jgi:hypothetical protein
MALRIQPDFSASAQSVDRARATGDKVQLNQCYCRATESLPEALTVPTGQTTLLHEPVIAVVDQHLGPQIGVISLPHSAAEDMGEASIGAFTAKIIKLTSFYHENSVAKASTSSGIAEVDRLSASAYRVTQQPTARSCRTLIEGCRTQHIVA